MINIQYDPGVQIDSRETALFYESLITNFYKRLMNEKGMDKLDRYSAARLNGQKH